MKEIILFITISIFLIIPVFSNEKLPQVFEEANNAYQKKDYALAIKKYESILEQNHQSAELHYNLGNAYYRMNQLGYAILHLEKAKLFAPNNEDINYNLELVRQKQKDEIEVLSPFFLKKWWNNVKNVLSLGAWTSIGLLFLWGGIAGLCFWLLGQTRKLKKWGFIGGIVGILLSILPFSLALSHHNTYQNSGFAILLEQSINLYSGPDAASTKLDELHEGLKVELLDKINDWYKVKLSDGEEGWLPEAVLETI